MERSKHPHRNLEAWKLAMTFCELIYKLTDNFPGDEKFGLTSQLRRASVSVASNIAEGAARRTDKEFIHFLGIALGSCSEIDTQIELSKRLGFISVDEFDTANEDMNRLKSLIYGLMKFVRGRGVR